MTRELEAYVNMDHKMDWFLTYHFVCGHLGLLVDVTAPFEPPHFIYQSRSGSLRSVIYATRYYKKDVSLAYSPIGM